ncbi:MAG: hypothetical protein ACOYID_07590, partial [Eubacteriales bacterium]
PHENEPDRYIKIHAAQAAFFCAFYGMLYYKMLTNLIFMIKIIKIVIYSDAVRANRTKPALYPRADRQSAAFCGNTSFGGQSQREFWQ